MAKRKVVNMSDDMKVERLVREVFSRRADGQLGKDIAKALNIQPWRVSSILHRKMYSHVTVGHDILTKVQAKMPRRGKIAEESTPAVTVQQALTDFTICAINLVYAERQALASGVNQDTLDLLRVAIKDTP